MATAQKFALPKTLAGCADLLYKTKQARLELKHQMDLLEKQESLLREHLIDNLPRSDALGVTGKIACATIKPRPIVMVPDWDLFYGYIVKSYKRNPAVFSLLQRRPNEGTIKEMIDGGVKIPGIEMGEVKTISLTKVGS